MDETIQTQEYFKQAYKKLEKIGEGSTGKVHKIENRETRKIFARKKILLTSKEQESSLVKFMLKYKTLFGGSNFIVQVYFFFISANQKTESRYFNIVMECLDKTLKAQINDLKRKNELMTFLSVLEFLDSMVSGLEVLNSNKIAHLDIKPQNIMLALDSKFYKIIDIQPINTSGFPLLSTMTTFGTLNYIAPEMKIPQNYENNQFKADIFSLGVTTLELCTLELNIREKLEENKFIIPLNLRNSVIKDYGIDFLSLLDKMISRDPTQRPTLLEIKNFLFKNNIDSIINHSSDYIQEKPTEVSILLI